MLKKRLLSSILLMSMILSIIGGFNLPISASTGDTVKLAVSSSGVEQKWYVTIKTVDGTDYRQFINVYTGQALASVPTETNGIGLIAPDINDDKQLWRATNITNDGSGPSYDCYILLNKADGKMFYNNASSLDCRTYAANGEALVQFNSTSTLPGSDTYCTISGITWYGTVIYFTPVSTTVDNGVENAIANNVTSQTTNNLSNQLWTARKITVDAKDYWTLENKNTANVMTNFRNLIITQEKYIPGDSAQLWEITLQDAGNMYYSVKNKLTNKYLSLGTSAIAGEGFSFADSVGAGSTLFQFSWTSVQNGGTYNIMSVYPVLRLQGNGDAFVNSFSVKAQNSNSLANQQWKIDKISTVNLVDYFTLTNSNTEKVLTYNFSYFTQEGYSAGNDAQLWSITPGGDGNVGLVIKNKQTDGNIILTNTTAANPGDISIWPYDPDPRWHYNTNGYGLWLLNDGTSFVNGSTYSIKSYYPNFYIQGDGVQGPAALKISNVINEINNLNIDLIKSSDATAVNIANANYQALTESEKSRVTNYNLLVKANASLTPLNAYTIIDAGSPRIVTHGSNPLFGYVPDVGGFDYGLGYTTVGDKIAIPNVDFGTFGAATATIKATGYTQGEKFGLYIDNDYNNLIGEFILPLANNGDLDIANAQNVQIQINSSSLTGVHTVNIMWISSIGSLFSLEFKQRDVSFGNLKLSDSIIKNITPSANMTVDLMLSNLSFTDGTTYAFKNGTTTLGSTDKAGTGTIIEVTNGLTTSYTIIVYGDVTGDGDISLTDLATIKQHLIKTITLQDIKLLAGKVTGTQTISISDLLSVKKHILGITTINQNR